MLEFYAAWVSFEGDSQYGDARKRVMRLLEGRKTCRDFLPAQGVPGLPKSSLDGQRETVLRPPIDKQEHIDDLDSPREQDIRRKLRIKDGEQLDVVGLVKRHGVGNKPYPSVSRVAADPWVRGNADRLDKLRSAIEEVRRLHEDAIQRLGGGWERLYAELPYEGTVVYRNRHHEIRGETGLSDEDLWPLADALAKLPEPSPYLAILMADGDRMGQVISTLKSADAHRDFSRKLSQFAGNARKIVEQHRGVLIYSGGDDVLAFVPVDQCLDCARSLHDTFGRLLVEYKVEDGCPPTLSVGIAIAHFMDDLEELRQYALEAEKSAKKPDRNGLAVHLHKRSGSPTCIRVKWDKCPDERLQRYAKWIRTDAIPSKLPYDLRKLIELYEPWPSETLKEAMTADVIRVIRDKQPKSAKSAMKDIEKELSERLTGATSLKQFCEELLVARQIAEAMQQAQPDSHQRRKREQSEVTQ